MVRAEDGERGGRGVGLHCRRDTQGESRVEIRPLLSDVRVTLRRCAAKCTGANGMNPCGLNFMANFTNIGTYEYKYGEPDVPAYPRAYRVKQWVGSFPGYGKNDTGWSLAIFCDADAAGSTCKPRRMVYIDQPQWYTEIKDFTKVTLGEDFTKVTVGGKSPWAVPAECSEKEPPAC